MIQTAASAKNRLYSSCPIFWHILYSAYLECLPLSSYLLDKFLLISSFYSNPESLPRFLLADVGICSPMLLLHRTHLHYCSYPTVLQLFASHSFPRGCFRERIALRIILCLLSSSISSLMSDLLIKLMA